VLGGESLLRLLYYLNNWHASMGGSISAAQKGIIGTTTCPNESFQEDGVIGSKP
jgi:hypothetical protein